MTLNYLSSARKLAGLSLLLSGLMASDAVLAGGVSLGSTRIIYHADARQVTVAVNNSDEKARFLIKSWVEDMNHKKSADFTVSPPLFMIGPKKNNTLRITLNNAAKQPSDREAVYWFNAQAIPNVEEENKGQNKLQLASTSRIKLFVRPAGLTMPPESAPDNVRFSRQGGEIVVHNPTPYHVTLVNFRDGSTVLPNTMVPPKDEVKVKTGGNGQITFSTINDYGAISPPRNAVMK